MNKYFSIIFVFIFSFVLSAQSQLLVPVDYRANLGAAKQEIINSGFTNPKLIAVLTSQQTIDIAGIPLEITFDLNTGKSPVWIYFFAEHIDNDSVLIAGLTAVQTMMGPQFFPFTEEMENELGVSLNSNLEELDYNDVTDALSSIKENSKFMNFYNNNQPLDAFMIALFVNESNDFIMPEVAYWSFFMTKNENIENCFVEIGTNAVICVSDVVSVKDNRFAMESNLYPNPSDEIIEVDNFTINGEFSIYDVYGRQVTDYTYSLRNNGITLNISRLASGLYYLRTKDNYLIFIRK